MYIIVNVNEPRFIGYEGPVCDPNAAEEFDTFEDAKAVAAAFGPEWCAVKDDGKSFGRGQR